MENIYLASIKKERRLLEVAKQKKKERKKERKKKKKREREREREREKISDC